MQTFRANGKLLITGEYAVLDGALALAVPTVKGQTLSVESEPHHSRRLQWKSFRADGSLWLEVHFDKNLTVLYASDPVKADMLRKILHGATLLNPEFLSVIRYYEITTRLEFDENWGLGSSSTLVHNVAAWAGINAYDLLKITFTGSGYDIACAAVESSIFYQLHHGEPEVKPAYFSPGFQNRLYFVYLNKKQNSREGIARYNAVKADKTEYIKHISELGKAAASSQTLTEFEGVMETHEDITSRMLDLPKINNRFPDYPGVLKSLGAWGGDFILACGDQAPDYFKSKGFDVVIRWKDMVR